MKKSLVTELENVFNIMDEFELENVLTERAETMDRIITETSNYYIAHYPKRNIETRFSLIRACDYWEKVDCMAIKEGVDYYQTPNGFEIVAYYGPYSESLCLYPISDERADELQNEIDNADFCESVVIDAHIAQYCF